MNWRDEAHFFDCDGETLLGILSRPEQTPADVGVVIVVGGPQYRAGSHRQFTHLAHHLAQAGVAVLRFDYRGMGDSTGEQRDFLDINADIGRAITTLQELVPTLKKVALWGLCDGASAALMYVHDTRDPRVAGLCLANPWVRSQASLARTHVKHYYGQRLREKAFWLKLLSGKVAGKALQELAQNLRNAFAKSSAKQDVALSLSYQEKMARAWQLPGISKLLLLSGNDYTAKEFSECVATTPAWQGVLQHPSTQSVTLEAADHTFSSALWRDQVAPKVAQWLLNLSLSTP